MNLDNYYHLVIDIDLRSKLLTNLGDSSLINVLSLVPASFLSLDKKRYNISSILGIGYLLCCPKSCFIIHQSIEAFCVPLFLVFIFFNFVKPLDKLVKVI